ncbi:MAG: cytochrome c1 [Betaproteobacteria bacterium]|nr:cytochrome c1 [Betaproteobacteria bacterium]
MKRILVVLLAAPLALLAGAVSASEAGYPLDRAPIDANDAASLQSGARTFVNYCLGCHGAQFLRYNRLTDIGLTEVQIRDNLMFTGDKVGDLMKTPMSAAEGKKWFGVQPPDLSVIARSRGADWLYTYLRTFYRDRSTATGWNNAIFPNVGMPHALWPLQGERALEIVHAQNKSGHGSVEYKWTRVTDGTQSEVAFDRTVRDLVNFLVWMGEPAAQSRKAIGIWVLFALGLLFIFAYALKREYWKDVK